MKTLKNSILTLGVVAMLTACGGNSGGADANQTTQPKTPTTETVATNGTATVKLSIINTGIDYIKVHICTEDVDGLKRFDLYRIRSANHNDKDQESWNLEGETKWCENVTFYGLYPDRSYIIKGVLTSLNGETLEFEKTAKTISDRTKPTPPPAAPETSPEPTVQPSPSLSPSPSPSRTTTPNKAPIANAGSDVSVEAGKSVKLDGSKSSDSDGSIVYYTWYDENGDVLSTDKAFNFSSNEVKKHIIRLKVTDDDGAKASDTVVVTVTEKPTPNTPPKWTASSYDLGTIKDDSETKTLKDLTKICSDADKDKISFKITSISVPDSADKNDWNDSIHIDKNGVLKIKNLVTNDPNFDGKVTIVVEASAKGGSAKTKLYFIFEDFQ